MNFAFSEEQEELRRIVRQFLDSKSSEAEVRRLMETTEGYDPATWSQLAEQLGLQSLIIPEEFGGQGYGYVELTVVLEEMGRSLLCAPYFSSVVLAAKQVGGAQKGLEMAGEYAKVRVQFGRPIGSFQAIKHKCADMLLEVESAKSAAYYAGWCASERHDELPSGATRAKPYGPQ